MEQKTWVIYKHTLILDCPHKGWSYIGQTRTPTKVRWKSGYGYTNKCQVFRSAIDKYGWDNFTHEVLEDGILTLEEANEREKYWIAYYHTFIRDPECRGYNMTPGGGARDMVKQTIEKDGAYQKVFVSELSGFESAGWRIVPVEEVKKLWYEANKEKRKEYEREYRKKYYEENREELLEKKKQYAKENREKVKAKQKEWMAENDEHIKAQKAAWLEANKEVQREKHHQYYLANRARIIERNSKRQQEKKEEIAAYKKEYQREYRRKKKLEAAKNEAS
jgi:hypothetical protein